MGVSCASLEFECVIWRLTTGITLELFGCLPIGSNVLSRNDGNLYFDIVLCFFCMGNLVFMLSPVEYLL